MMDVRDYQKAAMRTSPDGHDRKLNGCMGLIGESGEVVDVVKKWKFQSGENPDVPTAELEKELGDVLWYLAEISTGFEIDMMEAFTAMGFEMEGPECAACQTTLEDASITLALEAAQIVDSILCYDSCDLASMTYDVAAMINQVDFMLNAFCQSNLGICMQHNIEKLLRRYPDGFDPERSLHREE